MVTREVRNGSALAHPEVRRVRKQTKPITTTLSAPGGLLRLVILSLAHSPVTLLAREKSPFGLIPMLGIQPGAKSSAKE